MVWEFEKAAPVEAHLIAAIPDLDVLAPWVGPDAKTRRAPRCGRDRLGHRRRSAHGAKARVQDLTLREPQSGFEIAQGAMPRRMSTERRS